VHTRQTADPQAALDRLRDPLAGLAARHGLAVEPGRMVIELRPQGMDKGQALRTLIDQRKTTTVRGHVSAETTWATWPAFDAVRTLRGAGLPGLTVFSGSAEVTELAQPADLVVNGPDGVVALLKLPGGRPQLIPARPAPRGGPCPAPGWSWPRARGPGPAGPARDPAASAVGSGGRQAR